MTGTDEAATRTKGPLFRASRIEQLPGLLDPFELIPRFQPDAMLCLLESRGERLERARYSFLGAEPFHVFQAKGGKCWGGAPGALQPLSAPPLKALEELLRTYCVGLSPWIPGLPPLLGGAVGYLGYEFLHSLEGISREPVDDLAFPDAWLMLCGVVLATDRIEEKSWLISQAFEPDERLAELGAAQRWERANDLLLRPFPACTSESKSLKQAVVGLRTVRPRMQESHLIEAGVTPAVSRDRYLETVTEAREQIFAGEVFEVCTTQRFDAEFSGSGEALYRVLREVSPAAFAAYLRLPDGEVLCSSPERFLRLDRDGTASTEPIKGTRPRAATDAEDREVAAELSCSVKDRAENLMIVDLARNDLGRVCALGTVEVPELCSVHTLPFTHQLVSTVTGQLRPGVSALELLRATFPGGSMTGAPKIEAMKLISRLEPYARGVYSGAIGYIDFDGALDFNIVIRTWLKKGSRLSFHVGGAIVSDSLPEAEYQETLDKAQGLVTALELARDGL